MLRTRLPRHEQVSRRPLKKQAVHPTKKSHIKQLINRNAESSPLLRLPAEIREGIWKAAIGGRTIHIKHFDWHQIATLQRHRTYPDSTEPGGAFRHIECMAAVTENEAYEASKGPRQSVPRGEDRLYYVQPCSSRHGKCYSLEKGAFGEQTWISLFEQGDYLINQDDRITMCSMLGTCRQIYEEAYRLFWLSNTFSFDDPYSLGEFFGSLTLSQKRHFTNLHISCRVQSQTDFIFWNLAYKVFKSMSGLKTFYLCVEARYTSGHEYLWGRQDNHWLLKQASQPWLALRASPLANVTVVISDERSHLHKYNLMRYRWTVLEKKGMAAMIRADIINEEAVAYARQQITDSRAFKNQRRRQLEQQRRTQQMGSSAARQMTGTRGYDLSELNPEQAVVASDVILRLKTEDYDINSPHSELMNADCLASEHQGNSQEVIAQERSSATDGESLDVPMDIVDEYERQTPGYTLTSQIPNRIASRSFECEDDQQKRVSHHSSDGLAKSHGSFDTFQQKEHAWFMAELKDHYDEVKHSLQQGNTRQGSNDFDYPHAARHTQLQRPERGLYVGSYPPVGRPITDRYVGNCPPVGGRITDNKMSWSSTNYALLPVQRDHTRHAQATQQIPSDAHHRAVHISCNPYVPYMTAEKNLPSVSTSPAPPLHGAARQHGGGHLHNGLYHPYPRRPTRWGQNRAPDVPTTKGRSSWNLEAFGDAGTPG